jgi:hypothetical protein
MLILGLYDISMICKAGYCQKSESYVGLSIVAKWLLCLLTRLTPQSKQTCELNHVWLPHILGCHKPNHKSTCEDNMYDRDIGTWISTIPVN